MQKKACGVYFFPSGAYRALYYYNFELLYNTKVPFRPTTDDLLRHPFIKDQQNERNVKLQIKVFTIHGLHDCLRILGTY